MDQYSISEKSVLHVRIILGESTKLRQGLVQLILRAGEGQRGELIGASLGSVADFQTRQLWLLAVEVK